MFTSLICATSRARMVRVWRFSLICICLLWIKRSRLRGPIVIKEKQRRCSLYLQHLSKAYEFWTCYLVKWRSLKRGNSIKYLMNVNLIERFLTLAVLVFQNDETAAMLMHETNPVGVKLFLLRKHFHLFQNLLANWPREWKRSIQMVSRDSF